MAAGNGYSDGEQHDPPVLSNRELVVNTLPITLHQKGEQSFDLSKLFLNKEGKQARGTEEAKVTIEYTNNPSWLMVKALPAISNPDEEDAISPMSAIYANTITNHVQKHLSLENLTQESIRLQNQVEKLKKLQNPDGSFSWWKGMKGSRVYDYIGSRNDGSIECHRRCAEINRPDADFRHRLSLLADSTGSKRNEEAGGEAEGES